MTSAGAFIRDRVLVIGRPGDPPVATKGDFDAFLFTCLDNLSNLALAHSLFVGVLGLDPSFSQSRVLPAIGLSILLGSLFYAWQGRSAARSQRAVCRVTCLPFGVSTPSEVAFVSLILLPELKLSGAESAFEVGLFACFWSGVIEAATALFGSLVLKHFPQPALLATLSSVALALLAATSAYRLFDGGGWIGIVPLLLFILARASVLPSKFGRVPISWSLAFCVIGIAIGWIARAAGVYSFPNEPVLIGFYPPRLAIGSLWRGFRKGAKYLGVFIPLALLNGISSLQVIAAAQKLQNEFAQAPSLICNGLITMFSALIGNPFPTSEDSSSPSAIDSVSPGHSAALYLGHATFNRLGAGSFYMILQGITLFLLTTFGLVQAFLLVAPFEAIVPVIAILGFDLAALAFSNDDDAPSRWSGSKSLSPRRYLFAVSVGVIPGLALLTTSAATATLGVLRSSWREVFSRFSAEQGFFMGGAIALSQGFLLSSMLLSATVVCWTDRSFGRAAVFLCLLSVLSAFGVIHSFVLTDSGFEGLLIGQQGKWVAAPGFAASYGVLAAAMLVLFFLQRRARVLTTSGPHVDSCGYVFMSHEVEDGVGRESPATTASSTPLAGEAEDQIPLTQRNPPTTSTTAGQ